jgi:MFS family permease
MNHPSPARAVSAVAEGFTAPCPLVDGSGFFDALPSSPVGALDDAVKAGRAALPALSCVGSLSNDGFSAGASSSSSSGSPMPVTTGGGPVLEDAFASPGDAKADAASTTDEETTALLRAIKICYYAFYAGLVCSNPYQGVQLQVRGFDATWVGLLIASFPLGNVLSPLLINQVERRGKQHEALIGLTIAGTITYVGFACTSGISSAVLLVVANLLTSATPAMFDEVVLAALGPERGGEWGGMRAWGAYGWAITAPIASVIADYFGTYALLSVVMVICNVIFLKALAPLKRKREKSSEGLTQVLAVIRATPFLWPRFGLAALYGLAMSVVNFMYIYIASPPFSAPMWFMGVAVSLSNTIEIPLLEAAPWVNRHFSDKDLHIIALLSWAVRLTGYTVLPNAYAVALLEPLHGFCYASAILALTQTSAAAFPPNLIGTAIGLNFALLFGLGPLFGNSMGGYVYDNFSPNTLFGAVAGIALASLALVVLFVPHVPASIGASDPIDVPSPSGADGAGALELEEC